MQGANLKHNKQRGINVSGIGGARDAVALDQHLLFIYIMVVTAQSINDRPQGDEESIWEDL